MLPSPRVVKKYHPKTKASNRPRDLIRTCLSLANVHVHGPTIRRTMNNTGMHGRVTRRQPLLSKKNITAHLQFAKDYMDKPDGFWKHSANG